jgi:hypothetical protein
MESLRASSSAQQQLRLFLSLPADDEMAQLILEVRVPFPWTLHAGQLTGTTFCCAAGAVVLETHIYGCGDRDRQLTIQQVGGGAGLDQRGRGGEGGRLDRDVLPMQA